MKLVFIENNRPVTDSLTVAEVFGKSHDNVMRDIRQQIEKLNEAGEVEWGVLNFEETQYQHPQNKQWYTKFNMTEDGFAIVAMSYVTVESMKMKVKFLEEFKRMREELSKPRLPQTKIEALEAYLLEMKRSAALEEEVRQKDEVIALNAPKVALYDTAMNAKNNHTMERVSKTVGYGRNKLFAFLRDKKVLRTNNLPYQEYLDRGYFDVRQYSITHTTSGIENKTQTLVTPKGMAYIHKLLQEDGKIA